MTVEIYWGARPTVASEIRFLEQLEADLTRGRVSTIVLANFFTRRGSRQIDFLVVTPTHVCHVELKHYTAPLVGQVNGPWSSRRADGSLETIDRPNPYVQALDCKFALSDDMHALAEADSAVPQSSARQFYRRLDSVVCVFPHMADGSELPSDYKVRSLGYTEFLDFLTAPGAHPEWNRDHWMAFIQAHRLTQATTVRSKITDEAAHEVTEGYSRHFTRFHRPRLHELVPLPVVPGTGEDSAVLPPVVPSTRLADLLQRVPHVQLVGPSGSGKSHLAMHTALTLVDAGLVVIFVEAGLYEGRLSTLLDRCVARHCASSATELLRAAAANGRRVLLVVDGFNECSQPLRERLLGDLSAFYLRTFVHTLVTSQTPVPLRDTLGSVTLAVGTLDDDDRLAVLSSYGAPGILYHCEPFTTAYELSIAAECAAELSGITTRATLFDAFIRTRLATSSAPAYLREALRRLAVTMDQDLSTWLPVDDVRRTVEQVLLARSGPLGVIDEVLDCSIVVIRQGRLSFAHELLGRFLAVEAMLLDHQDPADLIRELRKPRHRDLPALVIPLQRNSDHVWRVLEGVADAALFSSAMLGECGQAAARIVRSAMLDLLDDVVNGMDDIAFSVGTMDELEATGGRQLSETDRALLAALGTTVFSGQFLDESVALLDATDAAGRRAVLLDGAGRSAPTRSETVGALYAGPNNAQAMTAGRILLDASERAYIDIRFGRRSDVAQDLGARIANVVADANAHSHGRLLLACSLLNAVPDVRQAERLPQVLKLCWDSAAYHVQLAGLFVTQRLAVYLDGHRLHTEVVDVLDGVDAHGIDVMLSTQLVDTMHTYGMIDPPVQNGQPEAEIADLLRGEWTSERCEQAYGVVSLQFESIVGEPYSLAIEALDDEQRILLYTMAVVGAPPHGFWEPWLLNTLIESADPRALPAFERWATNLDPRNAFIQSVGTCYALAMQGCAQLTAAPPRLRQCESADEQAWQCYGAIIFWTHKSGLPAQDVTARCLPHWHRLTTDLAPAAADALYWLSQPAIVTVAEHRPVFRKLVTLFRSELRTVLEWSLEHETSLTSIFGHRSLASPARGTGGTTENIIDMLGYVGDENTVELLRSYAEDEFLGEAAIKAIRSLVGR